VRTLTRPQEDVLSGVLGTLRVRSTVWCVSDFRAPWGFRVLARDVACFHVVLDGGGVLEVGGSRLPLAAGDVAILPHGDEHTARDAPGSPVEILDDLLAATPPVEGRLRRNGTGPRTEILCGGFELEGRTANPVLAALPGLVQARDGTAATVRLVRNELRKPSPGANAVVERLTEVLIVQALRAALAGGDAATLRDPLVARAIALLQAEPEHRWTVSELGRRVALSRSALSDRFRATTGESPMRYLARLRLTRAAEELASGDAPLSELARKCGYESETSLSRAFRREFGVPPGRYRRGVTKG
jgi:AraC-like DNA-binding protein/mannose-6-phosphate isomerase-like protein (cupin superfamily)